MFRGRIPSRGSLFTARKAAVQIVAVQTVGPKFFEILLVVLVAGILHWKYFDNRRLGFQPCVG